jgi:hypothetical protein
MTRTDKLALITALMLVCGPAAATAQSVGATGPARADTTDPNSAPARSARQSGITSQSEIYARGKPRQARVAARRAAPAKAPAPDKAVEAQANTARLMAHAMAPWLASPPALPGQPAAAGKKARR